MMMKLVLAFFTLISFGVLAQDAKADKILDDLSKNMKSQKSFYIEFSANIKNSATGLNENETGKGWVMDNKFHASYGENTIISNGIKTWTIVKEEKSVYEMDASDEDEASMNPKKLMTVWETGFKSKYGGTATVSGTSVHVINLYPKNPGDVEYHTIKLYVSKNSNELKKAIMKSKDGTSMTYTLTKFTSNPTISETKFVFDKRKYPGYHLIRD